MKITLCGSIAFLESMNELVQELMALGHEAKAPYAEFNNGEGASISIMEYYDIRKDETRHADWVWDEKEKAIRGHFAKIEWSDAVLIANYPKHDIDGYIGGNTLMEMALAFHQKKPIYLLHSVPEISYKEEILGMKPAVIQGNLSLLNT